MSITMYSNNIGGLNLADSPLSMQDNQATGQSYNYDYIKAGAISKILAPDVLNSVNAQLTTRGLGMHHSVATDARTLIRAAGTKLQTVVPSTGVITDLASDAATPATTFLDSSSTQPVVFKGFNTLTGGTQLWMAGGGMSAIQGYTGTNITQNGTPVPTGSITPSVTTPGTGTFAATGVYFYAIRFRKLGTQTYSNCALDVSATIANTGDNVVLPLTSVSNIDSTRFDQIDIFRSVVSGVTAFTTGTLIAQLASTATTYTDTGSSIASSQNIPRAGNSVLDNSVLATGTYKYLTAYKRRLITCIDSTIYLSDLNKPESWPTANVITIPSGGPITALGVIGLPSENTTGADEYLCIWKENEMWVLSGSSSSDWELLFVDNTGCAGQNLVVPFNGYVSWMGYTGIFIWNGRGQPIRVSGPIDSLFEADGDIDKSRLNIGSSCQYVKGNQVLWRVSHRTKGVNKLTIKMDTRLTSLNISKSLENPEASGVFLFDTDANSYYALCSFKPSTLDEQIIIGDDAGYVYQMFAAADVPTLFTYETKPLDQGHPEVLKTYKRVLVFVEKLTPNDLTLNFWADYRIRDEYGSKVKVTLEPTKGTQPALFDIALFDQAYFDDYTPDISPIEFNLHSNDNNNTGLSIKLRFEQLEANAPVRIHGYAIEWDAIGNLPKPTQQVV